MDDTVLDVENGLMDRDPSKLWFEYDRLRDRLVRRRSKSVGVTDRDDGRLRISCRGSRPSTGFGTINVGRLAALNGSLIGAFGGNGGRGGSRKSLMVDLRKLRDVKVSGCGGRGGSAKRLNPLIKGFDIDVICRSALFVVASNFISDFKSDEPLTISLITGDSECGIVHKFTITQLPLRVPVLLNVISCLYAPSLYFVHFPAFTGLNCFQFLAIIRTAVPFPKYTTIQPYKTGK